MCISQSVRGRDALGGAEIFPGLGTVGSCPPCAPLCAESCLWASPTHSLSPIRQGSQPSTPVAVHHHHIQCHCGLDLVSAWPGAWWGCAMGLRDMGMGVSDPSPRPGGIGDASWVVAMQVASLLPACAMPAGLSQPWGTSIPSLHGGLPQQKVGSGPHSASATREYSARHGSIHCAPLHLSLPGPPKPWQACFLLGVCVCVSSSPRCKELLVI